MTTVLLRPWRDDDLEPFSRINSDPEVMRHLLAPMTRQEASETFLRLRRTPDQRGWGVWAADADGEFAGMVGLNRRRRTMRAPSLAARGR